MKEMVYKNRSTPEILDEGYYKQYHYAIVSLGSHPCAYVELPENNQYYGKDYDNIPIECHGGLTYSAYGLLPTSHPEYKNGYWVGWDYAHYMDYTFFPIPDYECSGQIWTTEQILSEVKEVINQLCETSIERNESK